jgi:hypothetical protein
MPTRLLSIAAELSAPPSSPTSFREATMVATTRGFEVIALVEEGTALARDAYLPWMRRYGLFDYVADLLLPTEVAVDDIAIQITGGAGARLTAINLHHVLAAILPGA